MIKCIRIKSYIDLNIHFFVSPTIQVIRIFINDENVLTGKMEIHRKVQKAFLRFANQVIKTDLKIFKDSSHLLKFINFLQGFYNLEF